MVTERFPLRSQTLNEVPLSLRKAKSIDVFKSQVKTRLRAVP